MFYWSAACLPARNHRGKFFSIDEVGKSKSICEQLFLLFHMFSTFESRYDPSTNMRHRNMHVWYAYFISLFGCIFAIPRHKHCEIPNAKSKIEFCQSENCPTICCTSTCTYYNGKCAAEWCLLLILFILTNSHCFYGVFSACSGFPYPNPGFFFFQLCCVCVWRNKHFDRERAQQSSDSWKRRCGTNAPIFISENSENFAEQRK